MKSLWFIVPAHGRLPVARACLTELARTCDQLSTQGLHASAVVVADDENLDLAAELGFAYVERPNKPLGRKLNDGYELAGRVGVDFVVPFGTDDVVDPGLFTDLQDDKIRSHRLSAVVSEDGARMRTIKITYDGGDGIRVIPTGMLASSGFRPIPEDKHRAMDAAVTDRILRDRNIRPEQLFAYRDLHPLQIVEFKTATDQLNAYKPVADTFGYGDETEPFAQLAEHYGDSLLDDIRRVYGLVAA